MGTISISLPIKVKGAFRVRDRKAARKLIDELEKIGERVTPIDELFGIWTDRSETSEELTERLRDRNNQRNG